MVCSQTDPRRLDNRHFVGREINLCNWEEVKPLFDDLLERRLTSADALEQFILDFSGLSAALGEENARIQLALSVNTADEQAKKIFNDFQQNINSPSSTLFNQLTLKFLDSAFLDELDPERYGQLIRVSKNDRDLFVEKNVPLMMKDATLSEKYSSISGSAGAEFQGKYRNLTQISQFMLETDRELRKRAWETIAEVRMGMKDELESLYDEMVHIRNETAINAGFGNFRDFKHQAYNRFDYTPEDCMRFHETVEKAAVPILKKRRARRKEKMGLKTLRAWDLRVDPDGFPPLRPFQSDSELISACARVFDRIYPNLGDNLRMLEEYGNLDLSTRPNKAPVGFNMPLFETGVSFIFMNATGTFHDFLVLLHEGGHAIETRACAHDPILLYRNTPQEWGECASQSMELLGLDHLDVLFDDPAVRDRCVLQKYEDVLLSLVSCARNDAFQHWVYTHPGHSRAERNAVWMELNERFPTGGDVTGLEKYAEISWQMIPHLFIVPFYYIEYGISQIAALQVYKKALDEGTPAIAKWLDAMKIGYAKSIPELYAAAGLEFRFHGEFAENLIHLLAEAIEKRDPS